MNPHPSIKLKMTYKAVIFDFNGTLLWDKKLHNQAWDQFLKNHKIELTDKEKAIKIHGKPNADILKGLLVNKLNNSKIESLSQEKERIYRNICANMDLKLAPGAEDFISFLRTNNIDYAIATSSGKENVDFYIEKMKLADWIAPENIIFDDGSFRGKPHPDIFLKAMEQINQKPENVVVFEDSMAGIKSAENAKAGKIIIVDSNGDDYSSLPYQKIKNFEEVEKSLFTK